MKFPSPLKKIKSEIDLKKYHDSIQDRFVDKHIDVRDFLGEGFYLLKNGDIGFFSSITGIYDEVLTNREVEEKFATLLKSLRLIVQGVPFFEKQGNTVTQIHLRQRKVSEKDIFNNKHEGLKDDFIKKLIKGKSSLIHVLKTFRLYGKSVLLGRISLLPLMKGPHQLC